MSKKSINFDDKKINESNFYIKKKLFKIDDIDVNKIVVSKTEPYGTKKLPSKNNAGILKQYSRGIPLAFQR